MFFDVVFSYYFHKKLYLPYIYIHIIFYIYIYMCIAIVDNAVLVEKILRIQPDVRKLYLLVRAPDAAAAKERLLTEVQTHAQIMLYYIFELVFHAEYAWITIIIYFWCAKFLEKL